MKLSRQSLCAVAGDDVDSVTRPLAAPIYQSSVFDVESLELVEDLYQGRGEGYIYSRDANPNVRILERTVARLEGGEEGVACASGMGAISSTLLALVEAGDRVVAAGELYGGTSQLLRGHLPRLGIGVDFVDVTDTAAVEVALDGGPRLIFLESVSNPLLRLPDLPSICRAARRRGVKVVVDNTLATPLLLRPLELGADVVVHSATKYLGGHSDVTGGVVVAGSELAGSIAESSRTWGATLDPFAAWLVVRGIRTLALRVERACDNALEVARHLSRQPAVAAVHYPGLPGHPQHEMAKETLSGRFGAMVSFELAGGLEAASTFVKAARLIRFAPSLGEVRTTLSHPARTSHRSLTADQRAALGIGDGLIRLSCGIEDVADILDDIDGALAALRDG